MSEDLRAIAYTRDLTMTNRSEPTFSDYRGEDPQSSRGSISVFIGTRSSDSSLPGRYWCLRANRFVCQFWQRPTLTLRPWVNIGSIENHLGNANSPAWRSSARFTRSKLRRRPSFFFFSLLFATASSRIFHRLADSSPVEPNRSRFHFSRGRKVERSLHPRVENVTTFVKRLSFPNFPVLYYNTAEFSFL